MRSISRALLPAASNSRIRVCCSGVIVFMADTPPLAPRVPASGNYERAFDIYINSPGGSVTAALAIYDTMQCVKPQIATICAGFAASAATIVLVGGTKGKRMALPRAKMLIHQPWISQIGGQATDIEIHARDMLQTRELLAKIYAERTGQALEKVLQDLERDYHMSAQEAKDYGLIDEIVER
jgi:ATP-dependent Clp protease protease subunit